ncbi:hypothetical protein GA0116948_105138 [Chitinophaga costaii]|uniref:Uncharacterized protein n=1 Tax=Chitinophaga costaii TaxID=1335309 RepID=A0A1C4D988_9BACT|nr:hypothetical protein GA0116948_105138 [Chitinophaga costaii]
MGKAYKQRGNSVKGRMLPGGPVSPAMGCLAILQQTADSL